jgi:hypothetical protein
LNFWNHGRAPSRLLMGVDYMKYWIDLSLSILHANGNQ